MGQATCICLPEVPGDGGLHPQSLARLALGTMTKGRNRLSSSGSVEAWYGWLSEGQAAGQACTSGMAGVLGQFLCDLQAITLLEK